MHHVPAAGSTDMLLEEARNPATPPARLAQLARARQRSVRAAVVANPNVTIDLLGRVGPAHPEALATNPLLSWLAVEDPDHLRRVPQRVRRRLLTVADESLLWWATNFGDADDRRAALANGALPAGAARWLVAHAEPAIAGLAADHTSLDDGVADARVELLAGPEGRDRLPDADAGSLGLLASLGVVPSWLLPVAAASTDELLRRVAAEHPRCPGAWLADLLLDEDAGVRDAARANLAALAAGGLQARAQVADAVFAERAHGAERVLDDRAGSRAPADVAVPTDPASIAWLRASDAGRRWLAAHPDLGAEVAASMADAAAWREREVVAALARRLPDDVALALAADTDADVRAALARNPHCPPLALAVLATDDDAKVAAALGERGAGDRADADADARPGARPGDRVRGQADHPSSVLAGDVLERLAERGGRAALVAARAPHATGAQLDRWSRSDDWRVRHACAAHRSTPHDVLVRLGADPDYDVRTAVAGNVALDEGHADAMANDSHHLVRGAVARRTGDRALQRRLLTDAEAAVLAGLAANPNLTTTLVPDLAAAASAHSSTEPALALARRPSLGADHLVTLAGRDDTDLAAALARRRDLPTEAWRRLLDGRVELVEPVRSAIAAAAGVDAAVGADPAPAGARATAPGGEPGELLAQAVAAKRWLIDLLRDGDGAVPPVLHTTLAGDGDWRVREQVALDPRCQPAVLERLAADGDFDVRKAVAAHPSTAEAEVLAFASDTSAPVRLALLRRAELPDVVLDRLCEDEDDDVRQAAHAHPACPPERRVAETALRTGAPTEPSAVRAAAATSPAARIAAALHPDCPPDVVDALATDANWRVRMAIAERPTAPGAVLAVLGRDADRDVRRAVAANPSTPAAVIARLSGDGDVGVRQRVGAHPRATDDIRRTLRAAALVAASRSAAVANRAAAASCPGLPAYLRRRRHLWQSTDWLVRYGVAANPATEPDLLEVLARDGHRLVRRLARARLAGDPG